MTTRTKIVTAAVVCVLAVGGAITAAYAGDSPAWPDWVNPDGTVDQTDPGAPTFDGPTDG